MLKDTVSIESLVIGLSKDVFNERNGSSDEVVCSDGVAVRARSGMDNKFGDCQIVCFFVKLLKDHVSISNVWLLYYPRIS